MTIQALLTTCRKADIVLMAEGSTLHVDAPQGVFTLELRATLAALKPELLLILQRLQAMQAHGIDLTGAGSAPPVDDDRCRRRDIGDRHGRAAHVAPGDRALPGGAGCVLCRVLPRKRQFWPCCGRSDV